MLGVLFVRLESVGLARIWGDTITITTVGLLILSLIHIFSISVLEALSCGLGLLLSDIPSHREVVEMGQDVYLGAVSYTHLCGAFRFWMRLFLNR